MSKEQLENGFEAADYVPCQPPLQASLYDGKQYLGHITVLAGALTVMHEGMAFERAETRDIIGRKRATTRRGGVRFKRMDKAREAEQLAIYREYQNKHKLARLQSLSN